MKKGYLIFFIFLIGVSLAFGLIADKNIDYKAIVKETDKSVEVSAVLNGDRITETYQDDEETKEEIKDQLRELGYLD